MTSNWKPHEINHHLEWCWRKKSFGVPVHLLDIAIRKHLMETVHCLLILALISKQLLSDREPMLREFSADTYCKARHTRTPEGIFSGSWRSPGGFQWSLPDWLCQRLYLSNSSESHPQRFRLTAAYSKQDGKRMRAGTCNAETPISARGKLCFLKPSKWKN